VVCEKEQHCIFYSKHGRVIQSYYLEKPAEAFAFYIEAAGDWLFDYSAGPATETS
jgi:hypothetical protein